MSHTKVNDETCLKLIRTDLSLLGATEMRHIERSSKCRTEYEIYRRLEQAMAALPEASMPDRLRTQILAEILHPGYSLRHLLLTLSVACLSPVLLSVTDLKAFFGPTLVAGIYGGSGLLILLLLMPLTDFLISRKRIDIDVLKDRIDDLLERRAH